MFMLLLSSPAVPLSAPAHVAVTQVTSLQSPNCFSVLINNQSFSRQMSPHPLQSVLTLFPLPATCGFHATPLNSVSKHSCSSHLLQRVRLWGRNSMPLACLLFMEAWAAARKALCKYDSAISSCPILANSHLSRLSANLESENELKSDAVHTSPRFYLKKPQAWKNRPLSKI